MTLSTASRTKTISDHRRSDTDTGSSEVQIGLLTERINGLTDHLRANKQDHNSRRGLLAMVSRRNRLLKYLQETQRQRYLDIIGRLGLRK